MRIMRNRIHRAKKHRSNELNRRASALKQQKEMERMKISHALDSRKRSERRLRNLTRRQEKIKANAMKAHEEGVAKRKAIKDGANKLFKERMEALKIKNDHKRKRRLDLVKVHQAALRDRAKRGHTLDTLRKQNLENYKKKLMERRAQGKLAKLARDQNLDRIRTEAMRTQNKALWHQLVNAYKRRIAKAHAKLLEKHSLKFRKLKMLQWRKYHELQHQLNDARAHWRWAHMYNHHRLTHDIMQGKHMHDANQRILKHEQHHPHPFGHHVHHIHHHHPHHQPYPYHPMHTHHYPSHPMHD
jgi:hypothetical protein